MTYTNSFDEKLANGFDNNIDFDTVIASMDTDEIAEMRDWLESEIGYGYEYASEKDSKVLICEDYVREVAAQVIRDNRLPWHEITEIARVSF